MKIYRVIVRGQFGDLAEADRTRLLAEADEHSYLRSAFTADGTFTYDERLVAFNLRYEVRDSSDELDSAAIGEAAVERAAAWLAQQEIDNKRLRSEVTDMATMWT